MSQVAHQQIGKYKIVRELGRGGMGAVYLGEHELLGSPVAIKVLLPSVSSRETVVHRFFGEAKAATSVRDPGIVQIFDYGYQPDGTAYIVLEYLEGEALSVRLKRMMRLPLKDALRICRHLAQSLAVVHDAGIVHRDLKPANIILVKDPLVEGRERPKILDFGIAKLSRDPEAVRVTKTDAVIGTPLYMAPEQWRAAKHVDARADIYSLGCILYHLLTGAPPFQGTSIGEICAGHLTEQPVPSSERVRGLPGDIDALLDACMAKEPEERLSSMTALAYGLSELEKGEPLPNICQTKPRLLQEVAAPSSPAGELGKTPAAVSTAAGESTTLSSSSSPSLGERTEGGIRAWLLAVAALGVIVVGALGVLTLAQRTASVPMHSAAAERATLCIEVSQKAEQAAEADVEIRITSSPAGASVALSENGREGQHTPLTHRGVRSDQELTFWLSLDGYKKKSVSVPLTRSAFIHVDLEPLSTPSRNVPTTKAAPVQPSKPAPTKTRSLYER